MDKKWLKLLSAWLPVALWMGLIFHFSSGTVPVASTVYWQDFAIKKTGHVLLFGALSIFFFRALRMYSVDRKKAAIWAILLAFFYGATDEFHQIFTQGREARVRDVFIDGLGAGFWTALVFYIPKYLPKPLFELSKKLNLV